MKNAQLFFSMKNENKDFVDEIPARSDVPVEHTWDLEKIYSTQEGWEADFKSIESSIQPLLKMKGKLNDAGAVVEFLKKDTDFDRLLYKLYVYAHLSADVDTSNTENQGRESRVRACFAELSSRLAWATPELLSHSLETLEAWRDDPILADYRYNIIRLIRQKSHTLSEAEETLLAGVSDILSAPENAYSLLTNADMTFDKVTDENGKECELTDGRYVTFLENPNREVRKQAFDNMYSSYSSLKNTIACTLSTSVKTDNFRARTRNYGSALEASLAQSNIPVSLYDALIDATHDSLPEFFKYLDLRSKLLKIPDLNMFDMHVPIVPDYKIDVPYEQACEWVLKACEPLGDDYVGLLKKAFESRWIDIYENKGKKSGAYSSGCYDTAPYMLLNYQGTFDSVFTLAHELGHSLHSYLANHAQAAHKAGYPIFIAEIASTTNEALLIDYLLKEKADDKQFVAYLLNHYCDGFRGTVFRQVMFAEFEKVIHEMDVDGKPLTYDVLNDTYYNLNAKYHGEKIKGDRQIEMEWARIPHFYYNFYVYQYATSFCASQIFSNQILESETNRDLYLDLLRSGGSDDPLTLVAKAGVDLTDNNVLVNAFSKFSQNVVALENSLV